MIFVHAPSLLDENKIIFLQQLKMRGKIVGQLNVVWTAH